MKKYKSVFKEETLSKEVKNRIESLVSNWNDYKVTPVMKKIFDQLEKLGYMKDGSWLNNNKGKEANTYFDSISDNF